MSKNFIEKFNEEGSKEHFRNKAIGILCFFVFLAVILFNATGCSINNTVEDNNPDIDLTQVNDMPKETVKVGDDGVNAAIADDNAQDELMMKNNEKMVSMSVEDIGRSDPFLPEGERVPVKRNTKPTLSYDLLPPPEKISLDSNAVDVISTKVSGIMYDKFNPSAILNISGADYLVRTGDIINNYKILSIGKDTVTVQLGVNVYKAGVGQMITGEGVNYNTISNLESKFGGTKNKVNKK